MKICKVCKREFPEEFFYLNRGKYRLNTCRKCLSKRSSELVISQRKIKFSRRWYRRRFERLKESAKRMNRKFELTLKDFLRLRTYKNEKCFYCGTTTGLFSIDRFNNDEGYIFSNCVVACWQCNKIKSDDYTAEEMKIIGRALKKIDRARAQKHKTLFRSSKML